MLNAAEVLSRLKNGGWTLHKGSNPVHGLYLYMQCLADARCIDVKRTSARSLVRNKLIEPAEGGQYRLAARANSK